MSDITATSVKLTWYYKNPEEVQYYVIQHKPKHVQQAEAEISGITTMYYHVRSLSPYTEYELTVTAVNAIGRSPASAPVTVTTGETSQYFFFLASREKRFFSLLPSAARKTFRKRIISRFSSTRPRSHHFQGHRCRIVEIRGGIIVIAISGYLLPRTKSVASTHTRVPRKFSRDSARYFFSIVHTLQKTIYRTTCRNETHPLRSGQDFFVAPATREKIACYSVRRAYRKFLHVDTTCIFAPCENEGQVLTRFLREIIPFFPCCPPWTHDLIHVSDKTFFFHLSPKKKKKKKKKTPFLCVAPCVSVFVGSVFGASRFDVSFRSAFFLALSLSLSLSFSFSLPSYRPLSLSLYISLSLSLFLSLYHHLLHSHVSPSLFHGGKSKNQYAERQHAKLHLSSIK